MGDIFGMGVAIVVFMVLCIVAYYCIWGSFCVWYLDEYWDHYVKVADEYNLEVFHTGYRDSAPIERIYHFTNLDINIEIGATRARRLFKKLSKKNITKEKLLQMSTWESCRIPR